MTNFGYEVHNSFLNFGILLSFCLFFGTLEGIFSVFCIIAAQQWVLEEILTKD